MEGGVLQWEGEKNLNMYIDLFEVPFLQATEDFYIKKSQIWIN